MFDWILMTYYQIRAAFEEGGVRSLLHTRVFWQRVATPVEMELSHIPATNAPQGSEDQFIELTQEALSTGKLSFTEPSRRFKVPGNLRRGWRGFAFVQGSTVMADIWCVTPQPGSTVIHPDLKMLGIKAEEKEAYAFDMFIGPTFRGKNLAVPIQRSLQSVLKLDGFCKVYGFYWDDNRPALWMHRMLKFKELPKRRVSRFFFLHTSQPLHQSKNSSTSVEKFPN